MLIFLETAKKACLNRGGEKHKEHGQKQMDLAAFFFAARLSIGHGLLIVIEGHVWCCATRRGQGLTVGSDIATREQGGRNAGQPGDWEPIRLPNLLSCSSPTPSGTFSLSDNSCLLQLLNPNTKISNNSGFPAQLSLLHLLCFKLGKQGKS